MEFVKAPALVTDAEPPRVRNSPADLALFPTLRTAVLAITSKYKASPAAPTDAAPVEAASPASPAAPPSVPGLPGGSPFVR